MTETTSPPAAVKPAYERLTARERRFVDAIVHGSKVADAVRAVGYKGDRAHDAGYKMKSRPLIREALAEREALWMEAVDVGKAMIVNEIARVAFFDPRKLVDEHGAVRPLHTLDDDTAAAIQTVEVDERYEKNGEELVNVGRTSKVKVVDKLGALRELVGIYGLKGEEGLKPSAIVGPGLTVIVQGAPGQPTPAVRVIEHGQGILPAPDPTDNWAHVGLPLPERD